MKVLAINGSARKDGNTAILINTVFGQLENVGVLKVESLGALRLHQEETGERK